MFFAAGPIEAAVSNKNFGFVVPEEREGTIGYGSFDRVMKTLEEAISSKSYLVGDNFTAADVYCGYALGFGLMFGTIEKRPAFERYWDRLMARPAFARARQIDDALTPKAAS
jgi:glutathione S-transferase